VKAVAENGDWVARGPAETGVDAAEVAEVGLWKAGTGGGSTLRSGDLLLTGLIVGGGAVATVCNGDNGRASGIGWSFGPPVETSLPGPFSASLVEAGDDRRASWSPWLSTLMADGGRSTARRLTRSSSSRRNDASSPTFASSKKSPPAVLGSLCRWRQGSQFVLRHRNIVGAAQPKWDESEQGAMHSWVEGRFRYGHGWG